MDLNKIYFVINEILDAYITEGVKPEDLLAFFNADEENYKFVYNRIYRKLNLDNIQFESDVLSECLKDSIRDKVGIFNDMSVKTNESLYSEKPKETKYVQMPKVSYTSLGKWKNAVIDAGCRYKLVSADDYSRWYAFNDDNLEIDGFFTIEEPYHGKSEDYTGRGYVIIQK